MKQTIVFAMLCGVAAGCTDSTGCSLNGVCVDKRCECEPQWVGDRCEILNFHRPMVWESGYHVEGNASWGGNALFEDGLYHLFVAQMVEGCGLEDYGSNSAIARVTSKNVNGPYEFQEFAVMPFAHNPTVRKLPDGSGYVIYFIGGNTAKPKNCGNTTSSLPITTSTVFNDAPRDGAIRTGISIAFSKTIYGPWEVTPLYFDAASVNASKHLQDGFTNPSPHFHPNGSLYFAFQAGQHGKHYELIGVATAPSWNATYTMVTGEPVIPNDPDLCVAGMGEDPFLWEDKHGWHLLIHGMCPSGVINAVYAFSGDNCVTWKKSLLPPYSYEVDTTQGEHFYWRMERPQLVFQQYEPVHGWGVNPLALFNGVCNHENCLDNPGRRPNLNWQTWTISRLLKQS